MVDTLEDQQTQAYIKQRAAKSMEILEQDMHHYRELYASVMSLQSKLDSVRPSVWHDVGLEDFQKYFPLCLEVRLSEQDSIQEKKLLLKEAVEFYKSKLN